MSAAVRPIDTSQLGPIRLVPTPPSIEAKARELFARQLARNGPAWSNAANSVRSGFSNAWIDAGIGAIAALLPLIDEDDHGRLLG